MIGIENKLLTLKLNRNWKVVDTAIVGDALIDLCAGKNSYALDISYDPLPDGRPDVSTAQIRTVDWEEWITLPVRPWDFSIKTIRMEIRVPTVLVAKNYAKIPKIRFGKNPSAEQIRIRDSNRCQYTGKKLKKGEGSLDHVIPKSRGGGNTWENLVYACKEINTMKSDKTPSEAGLRLLRTPTKPKEMLRSQLITKALHLDWKLFLELVEDD